MMTQIPETIWILVRANVVLLVLGAVVWFMLAWARTQAARLHRLAWSIVLLQGLVLSPWVVEVPWLTPTRDPDGAWRSAHAMTDQGDVALPVLPTTFSTETVAVGGASLTLTGDGNLVTSAVNWTAVLFVGWVAGAFLCAGVATVRYRHLLRAIGDAEEPPDPWRKQWQELRRSHGAASMPLLVHDRLGPLLCRRPRGYCVVVPRSLWRLLSHDERDAVLRHELAHYHRGDVWTSLVAATAATVHWFNPMAWMAVRKLEETAEWLCDERIARDRPRLVPAYARAMLHLAEPEGSRLGLSAAGGAPLSIRLRRLLDHRTKESRLRRVGVFLTLGLGLVMGVVQLRLVERQVSAQAREIPEPVDHKFQRDVSEFAARIVAGEDALLTKFQQTLETEAGQLVMRDRAGWMAERLRDEARDQAIPTYLSQHFQRESQADPFARDFVRTTQLYETDIAEIRKVLHSVSARVRAETDEEKLLKRFLAHDAAAPMLYFRELRKTLRPDERTVAERLAPLFVPIDGEYHVRADAQDEARRIEKQLSRAVDVYERMEVDVLAFADELVGPPLKPDQSVADQDIDVTARLKAAMKRPALRAIVAFRIVDKEDESSSRPIEEVFEQLENLVVDGPDGLVIRKQRSPEVEEILAEAARLETSAPRLARAVGEFARKVSVKDPIHRKLKRFLESEVAVMRIADDYEVSAATPESAVRALIADGIRTEEDGAVRLRQDVAAEFARGVQEILREYRMMGRRTRQLDDFARTLEDQPFKAAVTSVPGRMLIVDAIRREFASKQFDGFAVWVDERFDKTDAGLVPRKEYREELREIVAEAERVERDLKDADF